MSTIYACAEIDWASCAHFTHWWRQCSSRQREPTYVCIVYTHAAPRLHLKAFICEWTHWHISSALSFFLFLLPSTGNLVKSLRFEGVSLQSLTMPLQLFLLSVLSAKRKGSCWLACSICCQSNLVWSCPQNEKERVLGAQVADWAVPRNGLWQCAILCQGVAISQASVMDAFSPCKACPITLPRSELMVPGAWQKTRG